MVIKNTAQIMPPLATVKETPQTWEREPAIKLPNGNNPAKVNMKPLITLPLNSSGTKVCSNVFTRLIKVTEAQPMRAKFTKENKYALDTAKNTMETENTKEARIKSRPLYLKSPRRANINAATSAPKPAVDISTPNPFTPTFNIVLAKMGMRMI